MTAFALIGLLIAIAAFTACGIVALLDRAERRERQGYDR